MDHDTEFMLDFTAEGAHPLREALILAFGWDKEQTVQHLECTWRQAHPDLDPPQRPPGTPPQEDPEGELLLVLQEDEGEAKDPAKQVQDKKKPSIGDFKEDLPLPNVMACCLSQYALQKIAAFKYVKLWYLTKEGCFEATKQAWSQADDAFGLLATSEVLTLRPVASVKASKNARVDHELSLMDILQACASFLEHIKEAG